MPYCLANSPRSVDLICANNISFIFFISCEVTTLPALYVVSTSGFVLGASSLTGGGSGGSYFGVSILAVGILTGSLGNASSIVTSPSLIAVLRPVSVSSSSNPISSIPSTPNAMNT